MDFGDEFYSGFSGWADKYTQEDRDTYPEIFKLPDGVYEIAIQRPLGIVFEETVIGAANGVQVLELVDGGNAEASGFVKPGDQLLAVTGIKVVGAKWERQLVRADILDFDTIMSAIGSNDPKWRCDNVIMQFQRPSIASADEVAEYLAREDYNTPITDPSKK
eukprot:CAMPEP_0185769044 /NCGR_PEP_ID=MMETSP1174-20130828/53335_1 /TAXON_ID=35687 /ORGANISM="Dictyocha speculum, Strain CCMP1381" /LENGTH=161 /DNA_ID=CAMNT_0028453985 /DNA_START=177 /DNA_END=662 /DNA_ORIENTATION=-